MCGSSSSVVLFGILPQRSELPTHAWSQHSFLTPFRRMRKRTTQKKGASEEKPPPARLSFLTRASTKAGESPASSKRTLRAAPIPQITPSRPSNRKRRREQTPDRHIDFSTILAIADHLQRQQDKEDARKMRRKKKRQNGEECSDEEDEEDDGEVLEGFFVEEDSSSEAEEDEFGEAQEEGDESESFDEEASSSSTRSSEDSSDTPLSIFLGLPGVQCSTRGPKRRSGSTGKNSATQSPRPRFLLPSSATLDPNRCSVVFDLDETMVAARGDTVIVRPHAISLLRAARSLGCEVVLWTAGVLEHTQGIIDAIEAQLYARKDEGPWFDQLIYRSPKWYEENKRVKDLSLLGRPPTQVLLIDNNPASCALHPSSSILVEDYIGAKEDASLAIVENILKGIVVGMKQHRRCVSDVLMERRDIMTRLLAMPPPAKGSRKFHVLVKGSSPQRTYGGQVVCGF